MACPKKSLSRLQQLGYEKLGMNKLPCKELTLSLSLPLSFALVKPWKSRKRLVTVDNSGEIYISDFADFGKLKMTILPLNLALGASHDFHF